MPVKLFLAIALLSACCCHAQQSKYDFSKFKGQLQDFVETRTDERFPNIDTLEIVDGPSFYFSGLHGRAMMYFGYESCAPCRVGLPVMIQLANDPKYSACTFIYITPDDTASIHEELQKIPHDSLQKITILRMSREQAHTDGLVMAFPTIYFTNADRIVKHMELGGHTDGAVETKKSWGKLLDGL